jgi:hypothetical protein
LITARYTPVVAAPMPGVTDASTGGERRPSRLPGHQAQHFLLRKLSIKVNKLLGAIT